MTKRSDTAMEWSPRRSAPACRAGGLAPFVTILVVLPVLLAPACLWAAQASSAAPAAPSCADRACHGAMLEGKRVHAPLGDGCETCHEARGGTHPDSAKADFPLVAQEGALCAQCHEAFPGKVSQHPPAAEGQCLACHDPHASARPKLLRLALNDQCFECHEREAFRVHAVVGVDLGGSHPLSGGEDPARKGERFTCVSCHEPHASDTPFLWRFGAHETFDLCGNCHAK